ncbi:MAG: PTS sugar transporter subunit IIC [Gemmatimonadaceae bacterium]|nr:PTS sugar transporter subunit IIC [Gemmatimonadaceae bacterium]
MTHWLVELLPVALLGAVCGLDVVSFPQAMISRPIVSATLGGGIVGNPVGGLLVGAVLELIALETLPFGSSRYPEWGSAGVVGGAIMGLTVPDAPGALPVAVFCALATAYVSGSSMVLHRRLIAHNAHRNKRALEAGSGRAVRSVQLQGLTMDLVRGGVVALMAFAILQPLSRAVNAVWHSSSVYSPAVVLTLATIVAASALYKIFHGVPKAAVLFGVGLLGGIGMLVLG